MLSSIDIVILTNGPGELLTWVRPVVKALRQQLGVDSEQVRISVILSPCPHASGYETEIAESFPEVDRVQAAKYFVDFLVCGRTQNRWSWRDRGVVLFLGGDQFFAVAIAKHLGYRTVIYAEWKARWLHWSDSFGVAQPQSIDFIPQRYRHKITVVGNLMLDAAVCDQSQSRLAPSLTATSASLIGLLPGSKPAKLLLGVPLMLAIAQRIQTQRPQTQFVIFVAPTIPLATLADYADPQHSPAHRYVGGGGAQLVAPEGQQPYLKTATGVKIQLCTQMPAYDLLARCHLCLTTVGANTAELAALAVPMLVLIPTYQLDVMRAWDGLPGLMANLPGVGRFMAIAINWILLKRGLGLRAWPNIWAKKEIVPEYLGKLQPADIAQDVLDLLAQPEKLARICADLRQVSGQGGAATKLVHLVKTVLDT